MGNMQNIMLYRMLSIPASISGGTDVSTQMFLPWVYPDEDEEPTQPGVDRITDSSKYNSSCQKCGAPAYTGLNVVECSNGCRNTGGGV